MIAPGEIRLDTAGRTLTIGWPDGGMQQFSHRQLRDACPCAECRRIRIDGGIVSAPADIALTELRPMGYGLQLVFSDGHERGIYPWPYLAQLTSPSRDTSP